MSFIEKEEFICLDCETTGLDLEKDQIIEIAFARFTFSEIIDTFETLLDPKCPIPQASQEIHNISAEMLQGKPFIDEVLPDLLAQISNHVIVGHGIFFDLSLIAREAKRLSLPIPKPFFPYIDTLRMARLYGESPVNSLEKLRQHFQIPSYGSHRAMSDVMVNIEVFKKLATPYKDTNHLQKVLQKPIRLKTMPLGKHKGRRFEEIPLEYLLWAQRKNFDEDLSFSINSEIRARKKKSRFQEASNPFSSLS